MNDETQDFERLLADMRPRLHRYCARMSGSLIDGEDIVQEVLMKAFTAREAAGGLDNPRGWLMRIAHNATLDFLRRRARTPFMESEDTLDTLPAPESPDPEIAATCLRSFMELPALQRSAVILRDVLDHSLAESAAIIDASEPAVKSALQRGRERLRALARESGGVVMPTLDAASRARLFAYVEGFRSADFDAVRAMLAEDVRLDLVARLKRSGKQQVGEYFGAYAAAKHWAFAPGMVDEHAVMLVYDRNVSLDTPAYFVALDFDGDRVTFIHDFLFARYAMDGMEIRLLEPQ